MVSSSASSVEEYMESLSAAERRELSALRERVRAALPGAQETMRYGMACYADAKDEVVVAFAAQKNNLALYACDLRVLEPFRTRLPASALGKSCVRFKRLEKLPAEIIETVLVAAAARMTSTARN